MMMRILINPLRSFLSGLFFVEKAKCYYTQTFSKTLKEWRVLLKGKDDTCRVGRMRETIFCVSAANTAKAQVS